MYNVELYIGTCLDSLTCLQNDNIEIIIINDGSTDNSLLIANRYKDLYPNIIIIDQENQGVSKARNSGIKISQGKYLGFLDSDDWLSSTTLIKLYNKAIKYNCDVILGSILFYTENETVRRAEKSDLFSSKQIIDGNECLNGLIWNKNCEYMPHVTSNLYRREFILNNNLFFKPILNEDELWYPQMLYYAKTIGYLDDDYYFYRQLAESLSHSYKRNRANALIEISNRLLTFAYQIILDKNYSFAYTVMYRSVTLCRRARKLSDKASNKFKYEYMTELLSIYPTIFRNNLHNYYRYPLF